MQTKNSQSLLSQGETQTSTLTSGQNPLKSKTSPYPILSPRGRKGQSGSPFKGVRAFTLVELIIVITILAILATIAFMSFQGYAKQSRDSNRMATVKNIENGVEIFLTKSGKVPEPDEATAFTGGSADNPVKISQGTVGAQMVQIINMNQVPLDPKTQAKYHYSVFGETPYYQIGIEQEQDGVSYISPTIADSEEVMISGNYTFDPSLPSLFVVEDSVKSGGIFDPSVCFVLEGSENTFSSASGSCIMKSQMSLKEYDINLVGYWDMETYFQTNVGGVQSGLVLRDLSGNNYNLVAIFSGGNIMTSTSTASGEIFTGSTIGKGAQLNYNKFRYSFIYTGGIISNSPYETKNPDHRVFFKSDIGSEKSLVDGVTVSSLIDFKDVGITWNTQRIISYQIYNQLYGTSDTTNVDSGDYGKTIDYGFYRFTGNGRSLQSYIAPYNAGSGTLTGVYGMTGCGNNDLTLNSSDACTFATNNKFDVSYGHTISGKVFMTATIDFNKKDYCIYLNAQLFQCSQIQDNVIKRLKEEGYKKAYFIISSVSEPFSGIIDEVKIYNRLFSRQEIAQQARISGF